MTSHVVSLRRFVRIRSGWIWIGMLTLGLFAPVAPDALADTPIDLMFVIDNSGSMRHNDPGFITPRVVSAFIGRLPAGTRAGMILFDQTARLTAPLALVSSNLAQQQLSDGIAQIDYKGRFTNSATGIERALYELRSKGRSNAQKGIVFITDGIQDTGDSLKDRELNQWLKEDLTAESRALGVRIFGIAFTNEADYALIQALASRTGGDYYRAYDASEIHSVFESILIRLAPPPPQTAAVVSAVQPIPQLQELTVPESIPSEPQIQKTTPLGRSGSETYLLVGLLSMLAVVVATLIGVRQVRKQAVRVKIDTVPAKPGPETAEAFLEESGMVSGNNQTFSINKEHVTIGRSTHNDIHIDLKTISSFHATIEYKNRVYYLEDQRSTNGTRLNDRRLPPNQPARLKSGDRIAFATITFRFVVPDQIPFGETIMISMTAMEGQDSGSTVVLDLDSLEGKQGLVSCMQNHLVQLHRMGSRYKQFADQFFANDILERIASMAHESLKNAFADGGHHCGSFVRQNAFYVVCSLAVSIGDAPNFYAKHHGGFLNCIKQWIKSEDYRNSGSQWLCLVTFGQDPGTWVSLTIVPTHSEPEPVEIMSVDFLSETEKASLTLDFDNHGRVM